jgi:glycine cleavage system H protein
MPEFLRATVDKFTFQVATDRLYTAEGAWVRPVPPQEANCVRLGVTDFMQQHNGDVAFVNIKPTGTPVNVGGEFAEIETMKVTIGLASPVAGTIVQINEAFTLKPELINEDPYGAGWLAEIATTSWDADRAKLLDPQAYLAVMGAQAEEELKS